MSFPLDDESAITGDRPVPAVPPQTMTTEATRSLSFVIPVYNERETLKTLHDRIATNAAALTDQYEIIFVDDGSVDGSGEVLRDICARDPHARLISLPANYGKATALDFGFRHARSQVILTLDADLQDDPEEISRFLDKIREGYDLVSGWRAIRRDPWHKRLTSKAFNWVVKTVAGLPLHDFNCGFKAYTRQTVENLSLYGELHRYIPVMVFNAGGRVTEIQVRHHPRRYGRSKYGVWRLPKGFLDLVTVIVTTRYLKRPLHFFGSIGLGSLVVGGSMLAYLAVLWVLGYGPIGNRPLLLYGILLAIMGVQLFSLGVLAELIIRLSHKGMTPPTGEMVGFKDSNTTEGPH
jgi:glycosyltransferase involved in cell wall biosynthesis